MPSIRSFIWREPSPPHKVFERKAQSNFERILKFFPIQWKRPSTNWWNCHGNKNGRGFCKYSMPKNRKRNTEKDRAAKNCWCGKDVLTTCSPLWNTVIEKIEKNPWKGKYTFHPTIKCTTEISETEITFWDTKVYKVENADFTNEVAENWAAPDH